MFTFEFAPDSLEVFKRNMQLNSVLSERIQLVQRALWNKSEEVIEYSLNGPGTSLAMKPQHQPWQDFIFSSSVPLLNSLLGTSV